MEYKRAQTKKRIEPGATTARVKRVDWMVVGILAFLAFAAFFIYNLAKPNRPVDVDAAVIQENIAFIESVPKLSVEEIESQVDALNPHNVGGGGASAVSRYRKRFENAIIVGDSVTEGLSVYGWLDEGHVYSEIGASVLTADDTFNKVAELKPKYVFFAYGMNDMGNYAGDAEGFVKDYAARIDTFAKKSPKTKIFVCSISIPNQDAIAANNVLGNYGKFNNAIKTMCKQKKIKFIDSIYILKEHPDLYAGDGIHVASAYYPIWMENMIKEAGL